MAKKIDNEGSAKTPTSTMSKTAPAPAIKRPQGVQDSGWKKAGK